MRQPNGFASGTVPRWLLDELLARQHDLSELPMPQIKICRGRPFSRDDYAVDAIWSARVEVPMAAERRSLAVAGLADLHVEENAPHPFRDLFSEIPKALT